MKIGNGKYNIKSVDNYNIVLSEVKTRTKGDNVGQEFEQVVGYYGSLDGALHKVLMLNLVRDENASIMALLKQIEATKKDITAKVKGIQQELNKEI